MTFPEWAKPGIYGAVVGAIAMSIIGFTWGGWMTPGNAHKLARTHAADEVTLAMVPVCLGLSSKDPQRVAKLATLEGVSGYNLSKAMMATGWATPSGYDAPDRALATACAEGLALDGS